MFRRILSLIVMICFVLTAAGPLPQAHADTVLGLPMPGAMVNLSPAYMPVMIKGVKVHPDNPLLFDFIMDTGNSGLDIQSTAFKAQSQKLIKYFLAAMTIKEEDLWVNLSPYEKDRMIPQELGKTEMGRDMLAQDYILKQLTASLIYPERDLGKKFWDTVYTKAHEQFGTSDIPVNTFNKVWIVADRAKIYEHKNAAYVVDAHLKVMLEEDYQSLYKHQMPGQGNNLTHNVASNIIRQIILPEIEKEVNQGQNFAPLRQMFYAMVLASWYKLALKNALLNQVYSNKNKTSGILSSDPSIKEKIYQQYLKAYKKGVFNYIKDDVGDVNQQPVLRKYFSGGLQIFPHGDAAMLIQRVTPNDLRKLVRGGFLLTTGFLALLTVGLSSKVSAQNNNVQMIPLPSLQPVTRGEYHYKITDNHSIIRIVNDNNNVERFVYKKAQKDKEAWQVDILNNNKVIAIYTEESPGWKGQIEYAESLLKIDENVYPKSAGKRDAEIAQLTEAENELKNTEGFQQENNQQFGQTENAIGISEPPEYFPPIPPGNLKGNLVDGPRIVIPAREGSVGFTEKLSGGELVYNFGYSVLSINQRGSMRFKSSYLNNLMLPGSLNWELFMSQYFQKDSIVSQMLLSGEQRGTATFYWNLLCQIDKEVLMSETAQQIISAAKQGDAEALYMLINYAKRGIAPALNALKNIANTSYSDGMAHFSEFDGPSVAKNALMALQHQKARAVPGNQAMTTVKTSDVGGIDLNAKHMGLEVARVGQGIEMKFNPAMVAEFRRGNFTGVEGTILSIIPIKSPLPILGLA